MELNKNKLQKSQNLELNAEWVLIPPLKYRVIIIQNRGIKNEISRILKRYN